MRKSRINGRVAVPARGGHSGAARLLEADRLRAHPQQADSPSEASRRPSLLVAAREVESIASHAGDYGALILFACSTGLRPQEWQALRWQDIDTEARTCSNTRTVRSGKVAVGVGKTRKSLRLVMLSQRALDALAQIKGGGAGLVWPSPTGRLLSLNNFTKRQWTDALEDADVA